MKTAEETLNKHLPGLEYTFQFNNKKEVLEAMEEFASQFKADGRGEEKIKGKLGNLEQQINYACYEEGMSNKLQNVWTAFFELQEELTSALKPISESKGETVFKVLEDLIFTASKLWGEVKPIKDGPGMTVTHPVIEEAKELLSSLRSSEPEREETSEQVVADAWDKINDEYLEANKEGEYESLYDYLVVKFNLNNPMPSPPLKPLSEELTDEYIDSVWEKCNWIGTTKNHFRRFIREHFFPIPSVKEKGENNG